MRTLKKLKDAKKDLEFTLTAKDIKCGIKCDRHHCAISEAVARLDHVVMVETQNTVCIVMFDDLSTIRYLLPRKLQSAVKCFDNGGDFSAVAPAGTYRLIAPPPSQTLGAIRNRARELSKATGPKKQYPSTGSRTPSARNRFARSKAEDLRAKAL